MRSLRFILKWKYKKSLILTHVDGGCLVGRWLVTERGRYPLGRGGRADQGAPDRLRHDVRTESCNTRKKAKEKSGLELKNVVISNRRDSDARTSTLRRYPRHIRSSLIIERRMSTGLQWLDTLGDEVLDDFIPG